MEEKDINLRSEEMQELMGEIPPKILKVSIYLLIFFTLTTIVLSLLIKYPEQIKLAGILDYKNTIQYSSDSCMIKYTSYITLKQKDIIKKNIPVYISLDDRHLIGNINHISNSFNMRTGLFVLETKFYVPKYLMADVIRYKNNTILTLYISNKTIFQKVFVDKAAVK